MQATWVRRIATVVLAGSLWLVNYDFAIAAPPVKEEAILGITQSWDKDLPAAQPGTVVEAFNSEAVRDNEPGLMWERSYQTTTVVWATAPGDCVRKIVGGRRE